MKTMRTTIGYRVPNALAWNLISLLVLILCCLLLATESEGATEQEILDAILERDTFTDQELNEMDINNDGKVDVADIVNFNRYVIVSFIEADSEIDETLGVHTITVNFSKPVVDMTLHFTVGGTAEEDMDYSSLSGSIIANGSSAEIAVPIISDTVYEGDETIALNLLPREDYLLGGNRTHTITLKDNPDESSTDYICILATQTMGVDGSTADQTGFPATLFSRTANINITFSRGGILAASLNVPKSIGIADNVSQADTIPASSVSYGAEGLKMVFLYETESESFVSDPSITSFNPDDPSLGIQTKKRMDNTLTITINETADGDDVAPFNISSDKFTAKLLRGTFSINISGILKEGTSPLFQGLLVATMQK